MPGMEGFVNFNGTLEGSIAGGGGGDVTDVKVRDSQETTFESVVNEEGVAEIDLISYVRRNELTQAIENVENSIDNVEQLVDTKQNIINYSTDEQVVGTWFGKPLYQKSYSFTAVNLSQGTWTPIPAINNELTNLSIDRCISCEVSNDWCVLSAFTAQYDGSFMILNDRSGDITVDQIIIKYTKTTD